MDHVNFGKETMKILKDSNYKSRFVFSSVFNRILSEIYDLIDENAHGHNKGNPNGEAAKDAEMEIND